MTRKAGRWSKGKDPRIMFYGFDSTHNIFNSLRLGGFNVSLFMRDAVEMHYNLIMENKEAMALYLKNRGSAMVENSESKEITG